MTQIPTPVPLERRPALVWVIAIYYTISSVFGAISLYLAWSGQLAATPAAAAYLQRLGPLDHAVTALLIVCALAGATTLLLLRKAAPILFTLNAGLSIATTLWHAATKGWEATMSGPGLIGVALGWAILIAVCVYCWYLRWKGTLR